MGAARVTTGGVLAIDIATISGWTCGRLPERAPLALEAASFRIPQPPGGIIDLSKYRDHGQRFTEFENELYDLLEIHDPTGVIIETAISDNPVVSAVTYALQGIVKATVWKNRERIRWLRERYPNQVKKHWTGRGDASKDDMIAACVARGWTVVDDNHADACALWDMAASIAREERYNFK